MSAGRAVALATLTALVFLAASVVVNGPPWSEGVQISDVRDYEAYGEAVVDGGVPYRDVGIEYPPGAIIAFVAPALAADDSAAYAGAFAWLMRFCGVALILLTAISMRALGRSQRDAAVGLGLLALSPLLLGRVMLQRFDLFPAALMALAVAALLVRRERFAFGALAFAAGTKVFPGVALPLFAASVWRRRGRRGLFVGLGVFAAMLAAMLVPFAIVGPDGAADAFSQQTGRPLHRESTGGAVLLVLHQLFDIGLQSSKSHGSTNFAGGLPDALATLSVLSQTSVIVGIWIVVARAQPTDDLVLAGAAASIAAFIVLGKVLSPQFGMWLLAIVPLLGGRRGVLACGLLAGGLALTQAYFPRRYLDLETLAATPSWLIAARNAVLVALLVVLLLAVRSIASRGAVPASEAPRAAV